MNLLDNVRFDDSCPPDKMFVVPPDVSEGLNLMDATATMRRYGIISPQIYDGVCREVTKMAARAAREGRVAVITNVTV